MHDDAFRQLLNHFQLSWNGYRKVRKGVKKRILRHMLVLGARNMEAYLEILQHDKKARDHCQQQMTVSISRFFRDRRLWECLKIEVFPMLVVNEPEELRVWSAGCARGEEVYSIKILWDRVTGGPETRPKLHIVASDLSPVYLEKAQSGIFESTSLKEMSERDRLRYLKARGRQWVVSESLKKGITWEQRDLLQDLPEPPFDLVFVRNNLLTYYEERLRTRAFRAVMQRARPGGFVVVGSHEKIPGEKFGLLPVTCHPCIFQRPQ